MPLRYLILLVMIWLASNAGCSLRSRYALDDPVYASKYQEGAEKSDLAGKLKQAIDARHTKELSGLFASGGVQVRPRFGDTFGSIELGREVYIQNYLTNRISASGLAGNGSGFVGLDVGTRLQSPTRLAPFVGVGGNAGISIRDFISIATDRSDSEQSFISPEPSRTVSGFAAVYPEVGAHFWLNGRLRLSGFGRYLVTTEGREFDDWLIGFQIALFGR